MMILHTIAEIREFVKDQKRQMNTVGLVPTMGSLHKGHLSLVQRAQSQTDVVVMSIFVNPLQFGPSEDFDRYPRNLDADAKLAEAAGVDVIFAPSVKEMYPQQQVTFIDVETVSENLCGASRPGHFRGVATVVGKLLNIVQPDQAFFGMKDAQQVRVIQQMAADLNMPVDIVPCPIVREPEGLAMSSRNVYLSDEQRPQALSLYKSLQAAETMFSQGERSVNVIRDRVRSIIAAEPLADIDYIKIVDLQNLADIENHITEPALLALAVRFGGTRLIDNTTLIP